MSRSRSFEMAFDMGVGTCRATCACGREYYDANEEQSTWEPGEYEALEADQNAIPLDGYTGFIEFEGQQFVRDCECWQLRAEKLMNFIDGHARKIAAYLNAERERKIAEAESVKRVAV